MLSAGSVASSFFGQAAVVGGITSGTTIASVKRSSKSFVSCSHRRPSPLPLPQVSSFAFTIIDKGAGATPPTVRDSLQPTQQRAL
jgi:hypothetical protein